MAASGLACAEAAAAMETMPVNIKSPRVHLLELNAIFAGAFDKNTTCSSADIAKCLERLNGVLPRDPFLRTATNSHKIGGFNFSRGIFAPGRLGRSPSTDSIAASNFSSDQGSVDSCNYSSHGSDSNSGSSPCSPEEPDRFSRGGTPQPMPPIPPCLQEDSPEDEDFPKPPGRSTPEMDVCLFDDSRTDDDSRTIDGSELATLSNSAFQADCASQARDTKQCYLQTAPVPNSSNISFQRANSQDSVVSVCEQSSSSERSYLSTESSSHSLLTQQHQVKNLSANNVFKSSVIQTNSTASNTNQLRCSSAAELQLCHWHDCQSELEGNTELVEHIRSQHVLVQKDKESFVCLWAGCKVYNRASCSLSWLERHILSHSGNKPFKCIVDNCSLRFPSQAALQRHVNSHFEGSHGAKANRCHQESLPKSFRRRKHLKYKRRSVSFRISRFSRSEDFFDANVMEQIRYKLVENHSCALPSLARSVTFQSRVKAKRTEESGKTKVLLEWIPLNILPDCWVPESSVIKTKTVPVSSLPPESSAILGLSSADSSDTPVKRRRK